MRLILTLTALVSCMLFSVRVTAQNKAFPGFYLMQNGQKVDGTFTNYMQWGRNPTAVGFVSSATGTPVSLTPANCMMFSIDGFDEYAAYTGKRLTNPIGDAPTVIKNSETAEDQYSDISTFLRLVTRKTGFELYALNDAVRTNFFYKVPGQPIMELRFKEYFDQTQIRTFPEYRQQLHALFREAIAKQKLGWALQQLSYMEEPMVHFFSKLFPEEKATAKPAFSDPGFVLSAGVSLNFMTVQGSPESVEAARPYKSSLSPLLSIGYMLPSNRNFGRFFFFPQVKFFRHQHSTEFQNSTVRTTITFKSDLIILPEVNAGINVLNRENKKIHFSSGIGLMRFVGHKHIRNRYSGASTKPYFVTENNLTKWAYTVNLSGGLMLNRKFLVTGTYHIPLTTSSLPYSTTKGSGIQFRVGYKL